jgi:hypothetical protein
MNHVDKSMIHLQHVHAPCGHVDGGRSSGDQIGGIGKERTMKMERWG